MPEVDPNDRVTEAGKSLVSLPQDTNTLALVGERTLAIRGAIKANFKRDKHFGRIPGTDKDTLYKPGADLILGWHKIYEDPEVVEATQEWGTAKDVYPFFHFLVRSTIYQYVPGPNGEPVRVDLGSALGECNSGEGRYAHKWLWASKMSAKVKAQASKEEWDTKTVKTKFGDSVLTKCPSEKEEIRSLYNTVLKMAQIRALRSSLAKVCATSEFYGEGFDEVVVETEPENKNKGKGTAQSPEVIPPGYVTKKSGAPEPTRGPKDTKAKTTVAGAKVSPKQAAELKFIQDVLAKDLPRFKAVGKQLFGDKYKDKGWDAWSAEDISQFKDGLSQPVNTEEKVDVETGELEPSAEGGAWEKEKDDEPQTQPSANGTQKDVCETCKTEIEEDRASLYDGIPGGPQCVSCAKKKEIANSLKNI